MFHVKHNKKREPFVLLKELSSVIEKTKTTTVSIDSLSLVPFVLSKVRKKKIISVSSSLFDDVYAAYGDESLGVVGVPFVEKTNTPFLFLSYHEQMLKRSQHVVSSNWAGVSVCVVDRSCLTLPLFDGSPRKNLVLNYMDDSFDGLLSFLKSNGFE